MHIRLTLIALLLLVSAVLPISMAAQDETSATFTFGAVSFALDPDLANDAEAEFLESTASGSPGPYDNPSSQFIRLLDYVAFEESRFAVEPIIQVWDRSELAAYRSYNTQVTRLIDLLSDEPNLAQFTAFVGGDYDSTEHLPYLPASTGAVQILAAQPEYLETGDLTGIRYVTYFTPQPGYPLEDNEAQFAYTFQGVTTDGAHYIAAHFPVKTNLFPPMLDDAFDLAAFQANYSSYLLNNVDSLNDQSESAFNPPLSALDDFIGTINISG
jgi:hypothetical protein